MNVVWHTCSGVWHTCSGVWQSCSLTLVVWATRSTVWHTYGHRVAPYERRMDNVFNRMKNAHNRMRGVWEAYDTRVVPCLLNNYPWRVFYEHDWTRFCQNSTVVFSRVHNRVCVKVALAVAYLNDKLPIGKYQIMPYEDMVRCHWDKIVDPQPPISFKTGAATPRSG